jgi:hypothetical protein
LLLVGLATAARGASLSHLTFEPNEFGWSDSVRFFQGAKGGVTVTNRMAADGEYSLELADEPGDADFPELLARFPEQRSGVLDIRFALLPTDGEVWNVALAGPELFTLRKDGMSVWLRASDGVLNQTTDGIPKRLAEVIPYRWMFFALRVDLTRGRYDLEIRREGEAAPIARADGLWNAVATPGVAVDRLSFISEPGDRSRARFYVDDVDIELARAAPPTALVAQARTQVRSTPSPRPSVPAFARADSAGVSGPAGAAIAAARPSTDRGCAPAFSPADVGLTAAEIARLRAAGVFGTLESRLLDVAGAELPPGLLVGDPAGRAFAGWVHGCAALARGNPEVAARRFSAALALRPDAWLAQLGLALAEARLGHTDAADAVLLTAGAGERFRDARYAATVSEVARLARDLPAAGSVLTPAASFLARTPPAGLADFLRIGLDRRPLEGLKLRDASAFGRLVDEVLLSEQIYCVLHDGDAAGALRFADGMRIRLRAAGVAEARWSERAGDAALALGDGAGAEERLRAALASGGDRATLWSKLALAAELRRDTPSAAAARRSALATPR